MRASVSASATKRPSAFFMGITISSLVSKAFVHEVDAFSTRSLWSRRMNCW
jgi:hypothetical protein